MHAGKNLRRTKTKWFVCRSLGVHCSKVRSLTLDSWEPELLKVPTQMVARSRLRVAFNSEKCFLCVRS